MRLYSSRNWGDVPVTAIPTYVPEILIFAWLIIDWPWPFLMQHSQCRHFRCSDKRHGVWCGANIPGRRHVGKKENWGLTKASRAIIYESTPLWWECTGFSAETGQTMICCILRRVSHQTRRLAQMKHFVAKSFVSENLDYLCQWNWIETTQCAS